MEKSPKKLVGITVAIVALLVSGTAVYFDYEHYKDASEELKIQSIDAREKFEKQLQADEEQNRQYAELIETQKWQYEELREQNRQLEELVETQKQHHDRLKKEFDEVYEPLTRHEKIYDYISLLYNRLLLYRSWVMAIPRDHREVVEPYYLKAQSKFYEADKELRAENFDQAEELIEDAYAWLTEGSKAYMSVVSSNTTTNVP